MLAVVEYDATSGSVVNEFGWSHPGWALGTSGGSIFATDGALLIAGHCQNADDGSWQDVTATDSAISGTVNTPAGTVQTPAGTTGTPSGSESSPAGTEDSGGGNNDMLAGRYYLP